MSRNSTQVNDPSNLNVKKRLGFIAKDTFLYGGASALNSLVSLITFPLISRYFSLSDFGLIDYFNTIINLINIFMVFGMDQSLARYFYEHKETDKRKQLVSESFFFQIAVIVFFLPLLYIFGRSFIDTKSITGYKNIWLLVVIQIPFLIMVTFSNTLLKWTFMRVRFILISVGSATASLLAIGAALLWYSPNVETIFIIHIAVRIFFCLMGLWFIREWILIPGRIVYLKSLIKFAAPLGVICVIGAYIPTFERAITLDHLSEDDLGLFAAGSKIAMIIGLPITAFQMAWGPFSLSLYKEENAIQTYNWILRIYSFIVFTLVFLITASSDILIELLASRKYEAAYVVVLPIAFGHAVQSIGWITQLGIFLSRKSHLSLYVYFIYSIVTIVGVYLLISPFGIKGVAYAGALGFTVMSVSATLFAQKAHPMDWQYRGVILFGFVTLLSSILTQNFIYSSERVLAILLIAVVSFLLAASGWILLLSKQERRQTMRFVRENFKFL